MTTLAPRCFTLCRHRAKAGRTPLVTDKTVTLEINGSIQRIRLCAERDGLPPILIVQAGPGFPLLVDAYHGLTQVPGFCCPMLVPCETLQALGMPGFDVGQSNVGTWVNI